MGSSRIAYRRIDPAMMEVQPDPGCEVSASCLECSLERCIYEEPWRIRAAILAEHRKPAPRPSPGQDSEQETAFSLIDSEAKLEVSTCSKSWQRRLEAEGAQPWSIDAALDGHAECRSYLVPKSWAKLPGQRGKR